jgi:hypothetical protein
MERLSRNIKQVGQIEDNKTSSGLTSLLPSGMEEAGAKPK